MLNTTRVEGCVHVSPTFDFLEYRQRKNCGRNVNQIFQKWEKREQTEWQTWFYVIMTVYETELQQYTCIYRVHLYYYIREQTEWKTWLYVIMTLYEAVLPQFPVQSTTICVAARHNVIQSARTTHTSATQTANKTSLKDIK